MRLALISDVHSNVFALRAALGKIKEYSPDKLIFLGDLVGGGAYPEETVQLARRQSGAIFIKGNHDLFAYTGNSPYRPQDIRSKIIKWQYSVLSDASKEFLKNMKETETLVGGGKKVVCLHYPKKENGWFKIPVLLPNEDEVEQIFEGMDGDVFLFGHEHTGSFHVIGDKYYINFGTCGNYVETGLARCGIVDVTSEKVAYKLINAEYDDEIPKKKAEEILKILGDK